MTCVDWEQESNTHSFPFGPNQLLLAELNMTVATWSLWEQVQELIKALGGPTQALLSMEHAINTAEGASCSYTGL